MAVVVKTVLSKPTGSHFGVGEFTHFRTYFSGDWDVHWKYGLWILTHGQMDQGRPPSRTQRNARASTSRDSKARSNFGRCLALPEEERRGSREPLTGRSVTLCVCVFFCHGIPPKEFDETQQE